MTGLARLHRLVKKLDRLDLISESLGRIEARQLAGAEDTTFEDHEFRVYSQAGEDGLIGFLVRNVRLPRRYFVEFGVEIYTEANTRFLLTSEGWSGLVMDGSAANIEYIRRDPAYWRCDLTAVSGFITAENINALLTANGASGEIGLLSIDIDGNDYWVWKATVAVSPAIVVIEYNSRFGPDRSVTVPYDPHFVRSRAHPSSLYFGASLRALVSLGERKGYAFVGSNRLGSNAFFVRRDLLGAKVKAVSVEDGYVQARFHEERDELGRPIRRSTEEEEALLRALPLVTVE